MNNLHLRMYFTSNNADYNDSTAPKGVVAEDTSGYLEGND